MNTTENGKEGKGQIFTLDDGKLRDHVAELVRQNVEETLNGLLYPKERGLQSVDLVISDKSLGLTGIWLISFQKRNGNGVSCIFIAMS